MAKGKRATSLQDIADATGYSLMTVSRAIRGTGKVKETTGKEIFAKAEELGYEYNPEITRMMSLMRGGRRDRYHENIALLWFSDPETVRKSPFLKAILDGALARAGSLGYKLESFHFEAYEFKARRIAQAIESRGIRGIILFPLVQNKELVLSKFKMDWDRFAWVAFGNTHGNHEFHRVGHHHFFGMEQAMDELKRRGYQKPFLQISKELNWTVHQAYTASFIVNHPQGPTEALQYCAPHDISWEELPGNLRRLGVDVLISGHSPQMLKSLKERGIEVPGNMGYVSLHCDRSHELTGIHQCNDILGEYAVDMLVAQLQRRERGLPKNPKLMLHKGRWHEGETLIAGR